MTQFSLTRTAWQLVASAGTTVEIDLLSTAGARLTSASSMPAIDADGETLTPDDPYRKYDAKLPSNLYAIAISNPASLSVQPIGAAGGASGGTTTTGDVTPAGTSGANAQAVQGATGGVPVRTQPVGLPSDVRSTFSLDATKTSGAGSFADITLTGQGLVSLKFSGFAGGAVVTYLSSNDPAVAPTSPISALNASTGVTSPTRSTDGETRVPVAGRVTLRLQVSNAGTGTINGTVNVTGVAVSGIVDLGSPIPAGNNVMGGVTMADGANATVGAKADAAANVGTASPSTNGTVIAWLRGMLTVLGDKSDLATGTGVATTAIGALRAIRDALIGPTPASQAGPALGPAAALGVVQQDGMTTTLSASAAGPLTNATYTTGAIPTAGYASLTVSIISLGSGNQTLFEGSNDGTNWFPVLGYLTSNTGNVAPGSSFASTGGNYVIPANTATVRLRISTYSSGTVTAVLTMKVTNVAPIANYSTLASGASVSINGGSAGIGGINAVSVTGGVSNFSRLASSAAGTNLTLAKAAAGRGYTVDGYNTTNAVIYLKVYNVATLTGLTVGTSTPFNTIPLPPGAFPRTLAADIGWYMSAGIAYAFSSTPTDAAADGTGITAGAITGFSFGIQ